MMDPPTHDFEQLVIAQGGSLNHELRVANAIEIHATLSGFVSMIETEELGLAIIAMGGGRDSARTKDRPFRWT